MYVDAARLETVVERQRLVDGPGDVKPDMTVDTAMIGIEVIRVPLKWSPGGPLTVGLPIVNLDGQHILTRSEIDGVGDIDPVSSDSVFIQANRFAIEKDVAGLSHALELEENLAISEMVRNVEVFSVPGER